MSEVACPSETSWFLPREDTAEGQADLPSSPQLCIVAPGQKVDPVLRDKQDHILQICWKIIIIHSAVIFLCTYVCHQYTVPA